MGVKAGLRIAYSTQKLKKCVLCYFINFCLFQASGDISLDFKLTDPTGTLSVKPSQNPKIVKKQNYFRLYFDLKSNFRGVTNVFLQIKVNAIFLKKHK